MRAGFCLQNDDIIHQVHHAMLLGGQIVRVQMGWPGGEWTDPNKNPTFERARLIAAFCARRGIAIDWMLGFGPDPNNALWQKAAGLEGKPWYLKCPPESLWPYIVRGDAYGAKVICDEYERMGLDPLHHVRFMPAVEAAVGGANEPKYLKDGVWTRYSDPGGTYRPETLKFLAMRIEAFGDTIEKRSMLTLPAMECANSVTSTGQFRPDKDFAQELKTLFVPSMKAALKLCQHWVPIHSYPTGKTTAQVFANQSTRDLVVPERILTALQTVLGDDYSGWTQFILDEIGISPRRLGQTTPNWQAVGEVVKMMLTDSPYGHPYETVRVFCLLDHESASSELDRFGLISADKKYRESWNSVAALRGAKQVPAGAGYPLWWQNS